MGQEKSDDFYSYFLASVSHEFRTPLSALNASIELLLDEVDHLAPAERDELLNSIHLSVTSLQMLVDNLLETGTIEAGRFTIHRRPTSFNTVLAEAIRVMQPLLDRRNQSLKLSEPLHMPELLIDPTRLTQVMINLIANASKYSPIKSLIEIVIEQHSERLYIGVIDEGSGIPDTQRDTVFGRFVRGKQVQGQHGVGLGLSMVKTIIEEHGGQVAIGEHTTGKTLVWFTLPL